MHFHELGIPEALTTGLESQGLTTPLAIQEQALPLLLAGKSALLISRTGSGKTLAYLLPILARINPDTPHVQALILAPTHELALQIRRVATELLKAANLPLRVQALIGGVAVNRQLEGLKKKPHLVVGSTGRVDHLAHLGKLKLGHLAWLVLDEVDRLLVEEGLVHVRRLAKAAPSQTQYVFASATGNPVTTRIAQELAPALEMVNVQEESINPAIRHLFLVCEERDKIEVARKLLHALKPKRALVFVHRGTTARDMAERLEFHHLRVADLYGAQDKFARQAALETFRKGQTSVLVASDIAARGLDIADVDVVINLDAPSQSRDYLHRAGRTGRVDAPGTVISLLTANESRLAKRYAADLQIPLEEIRLSHGTVIAV